MEAMLTSSSNTLMCFSKSVPHRAPSSLLHKPSRVSFASNWKNAGEGKLRGSAIYNGYDASQAGKDIDEAAKRTKDTINEGTDKSKDLAGSIVEKVKDKNPTKEGTNSAAEALEGAGKKSESDREAAGKAVSDAAKSVEKKAGEVWESTKEAVEKVKDSVVKE